MIVRRAFSAAWAAIAVVAALSSSSSTGCGAPDARTDVSYDDRFGDRTIMDVYLPSGGDADKHPGVLMIHGGSWNAGSRAEYTDAAKRLARSGYVAATIEYRLVGEGGGYPQTVQDCLCALAHFRSRAGEYHLDPTRVAIMGYSAGGHLVALMGVAARVASHAPDCAIAKERPDLGYPPAAVVVGAGVTDFRGRDVGVFRDLLGGSEEEVPANYQNASPMFHVGPSEPPYLFVSGSADWWVSVDDSRRMRDGLRALGNDAHLLEVSGGGHLLNETTDLGQVTIETSEMTSESWIAVMDFLGRTIGR